MKTTDRLRRLAPPLLAAAFVLAASLGLSACAVRIEPPYAAYPGYYAYPVVPYYLAPGYGRYR